jgi:hypothetical protein
MVEKDEGVEMVVEEVAALVNQDMEILIQTQDMVAMDFAEKIGERMVHIALVVAGVVRRVIGHHVVQM